MQTCNAISIGLNKKRKKLKLKYKISLLLILFYNCLTYCQKSVKVEYELSIEIENKIQTSETGDRLIIASDGAKHLKFYLIYNDSLSVFKKKEQLDLENNSIEIALSYVGMENDIYSTKNFNYANNDESIFPANKYVINSKRITNWVITSESKTINGYVCYKATTEIIKEIKYLNETFRFPVTAWFCPKIPSDFGPYGYGKLPGLILQLQENFKIFNARKIEFLTNNTIISLPTKGVPINISEYENSLYEYLRN